MESVGIDGKLRPFEHPFVQACSMFMGEILCLLTFKVLYFHFKRKNVRINNLNQFESGFSAILEMFPSAEEPHIFLLKICTDFGSVFVFFSGRISRWTPFGQRQSTIQQISLVRAGNVRFKVAFPVIIFLNHIFFYCRCDMIATSTMYVGLTLTFASSFQMFRGEEAKEKNWKYL